MLTWTNSSCNGTHVRESSPPASLEERCFAHIPVTTFPGPTAGHTPGTLCCYLGAVSAAIHVGDTQREKKRKGGGNVQKARMPVCRLCTGPLTTRLPASPVAAAVISQPPPPTEDTGCPGGVFCYLFVAPGPRQGVCIISELYLPRSAGVRGRDDGADPTPMSNPFAASVADKSAASVVCSVRSTGGSSW